MTAFYLQAPFTVKLDGLRIDDVFLFEYAGAERFFRIVIEYGHGSLQDDGAAVRTFIDEVYRTATDLDAIGEYVTVRMSPRETRQQGRMDVHDASCKVTHEIRRQDAHETCQHDQRNTSFFECRDQCLFKGFTAFMLLAVNANSPYASFFARVSA